MLPCIIHQGSNLVMPNVNTAYAHLGMLTICLPSAAASQKAYWDIKSRYMDVVVFFKVTSAPLRLGMLIGLGNQIFCDFRLI